MIWNEKIAKEISLNLLKKLAIDGKDIELIRFGENGVFKSNKNAIVIRACRPTKTKKEITDEISICTYLENHNFKGPKLSRLNDSQPYLLSDVYVTIWDLIPHDENQEVKWSEFGRLIRQFHDLTTKFQKKLPEYNPFNKMHKRVEGLTTLSHVTTSEINCLENWVFKLEEKFKTNKEVFSKGVIHGDAHPGNLIVSNNKLFLVDYENVSIGDQAWDLIPILISKKRFSLSKKDFIKFMEGYGRDIYDWGFVQDAILIRELNMTLWLFQNADLNVKIRKELDLRMLHWNNNGRDNSKWNKF